jgi:hypothetical protein
MTDLKPCPFCGGNNLRRVWHDLHDLVVFSGPIRLSVFCRDCFAIAIDEERWNRRVSPWRDMKDAPTDRAIIVQLGNDDIFRATWNSFNGSWEAGSDIGWVNPVRWMEVPE